MGLPIPWLHPSPSRQILCAFPIALRLSLEPGLCPHPAARSQEPCSVHRDFPGSSGSRWAGPGKKVEWTSKPPSLPCPHHHRGQLTGTAPVASPLPGLMTPVPACPLTANVRVPGADIVFCLLGNTDAIPTLTDVLFSLWPEREAPQDL